MKYKKDFYKKKKRKRFFTLKKKRFTLFCALFESSGLCLIWSAGWKCVFYLKYLCVVDVDFSHTS